MPTINPRVNVTLKPNQYELLTRLGRAQGRSRSAILLELLELVFPVLERVVVAVEGAQKAQDMARDGIRESVERAEQAILPHVAAAMGQLDAFVDQVVGLSSADRETSERPPAGGPEAAGGRRSRPRNPRPVTRGSPRGGKAPNGAPQEALGAAIAARVRRGPQAGRRRAHR
jgi:hypothetical protein